MLSSLLCPDAIPKDLYFFDFSIAPSLMLYSYVPAIIASFLIGIFVMIKSKFTLQSKLLFAISLSFSLWVLNYFIQWTIAFVTPDFLSWQMTPIFMLSMFFFSAYFVYVFLEKKDVPILYKLISGLFFLPVLILLPSRENIYNFNLTDCEGVAGNLWKYIYSLEALIIILIIFVGIRKYILAKGDKQFRKEIIYLTIGASAFLGISWLSDVLGEVTKQYQLNFIGPIGMVVFIGLLSFLIVKYKAFNIKLLGAQALVVSLVLLISSEFFFTSFENTINLILISVTVLLAVIFGIFLIDSVKNEVQRKEELQLMSNKLAVANDQLRKLDNSKSEFISIASHQLRTPLTAIKGFVSLLLEGAYGKLEPKQEESLNKVYTSNDRLINLVEDLLNVSRMESGRMEFKFAPTKMEDLCQEIIDTFVLRAKEKGLYLHYKKPETALPEIVIDAGKVKEVVSNMVDNALKYSPRGGVTLKLSQEGGQVRVTVSDTGIGIPATELPYLFNKFSRGKDIGRLNTGGTGLGLYVGKGMIENNGGRIWAESDGEGKGSRFIIELPVKQSQELLERWG
jgi:signal transduction histidine kinase